MWQNAAAKKLALSYLAQALVLLPKVSIDDNPGDGGPAPGKLRDDEVGAIYVTISKAQLFLGQEAAAKATLLKAQTLIPVAQSRTRVRQGLVDTLLNAYLDFDWLKEAAALHRKYETYPERVLRVFANSMSSFPKTEALAIFHQGIVAAGKQDSLPNKIHAYAVLAWAAQTAGLLDEKNKLFATMEPLTADFLKRYAADYALITFGPLCHAVVLGLNTDAEAIAKLLQAAVSQQPGWAAMGYLHLEKSSEAKSALARLTKDSPASAFPPSLADLLGLEDYVTLIKRTRNTKACVTAALSPEEKLPLDFRVKLLKLATTIDANAVDTRSWKRLLDLAYEGVEPTTFTQIRALLKKELPEREKYWRSHPGVGGLELSVRQAEWTEIVEQAAKADPPTAYRYLARITEARRRLPALAALAEAEAWRARPKGKGDLG